jgi:hypothetical protein
MLEGKAHGLQVREEADEAFFSGDAVLNDLIADQESLHARFHDVRHTVIVRKYCRLSKRMNFSARDQGGTSYRFLD